MKVAEYILNGTKPIISFEFSRPVSEKAAANLDKAIVKLKNLKPDYVSVTFGAGGSNYEGSIDLIKKLKVEHNLKTVAYIAGVGIGEEKLTEVLDQFKELEIKTDQVLL